MPVYEHRVAGNAVRAVLDLVYDHPNLPGFRIQCFNHSLGHAFYQPAFRLLVATLNYGDAYNCHFFLLKQVVAQRVIPPPSTIRH